MAERVGKMRLISWVFLLVTMLLILLHSCEPIGSVTPDWCRIYRDPEWIDHWMGLACLDDCVGYDSEGGFADIDIWNQFNTSVTVHQMTIAERSLFPKIRCTTSPITIIPPRKSAVLHLTDCDPSPGPRHLGEGKYRKEYNYNLEILYQLEGENRNRTAKGRIIKLQVAPLDKRPCIEESLLSDIDII